MDIPRAGPSTHPADPTLRKQESHATFHHRADADSKGPKPNPPTSSTNPPLNRDDAFIRDVTQIIEEVLRSKAANPSIPPETPPKKGRNLVVCIDGTANQFGLTNTNVVELFSRLIADEEQLIYYNSGIATYVAENGIFMRIKQKVTHWMDMAFATGHAQITLKAYQWLSENYIPGDRVFLFGFSRGAYQVRIISGMIEVVGLLRKGNNEQIPFAYQLYMAMIKVEERERRQKKKRRKSKRKGRRFRGHTTIYRSIKRLCARFKKTFSSGDQSEEETFAFGSQFEGFDLDELQSDAASESSDGDNGPSEEEPPTVELCTKFKSTLSHEHFKVHFVGVWDTVSSIGLTRGPSFPETTRGMLHVRAFRHALSLNERRVKYLPEYGNGALGPLIDESTGKVKGDVKEVWFVGSHSDIGGGNIRNIGLNSFGPPLRWMLYEAIENGLLVRPYEARGWGDPRPIDSMRPFWRFLELLPFKRLSYDGQDRSAVTYWPHLSAGRRIQGGQLVHESAVNYLELEANKQHRTGARFQADTGHWVALEEHLSLIRGRISKDLHAEIVHEQIEKLKRATNEGSPITRGLADTLSNLLKLAVPRQSLVDSLVIAETADAFLEALRLATEASSETIADDESPTIIKALSSVLSTVNSRPRECKARDKALLSHWLRHADAGDWLQVMRIFGLDVISGHHRAVSSAAYSPNGEFIVSGSYDNTIRLWKQTGHPVGEPLRGHTDKIHSVAFSPDGTRLASGSGDSTIRIWDVATQQAVGSPFTGHDGPVLSVAYSPDGKHVVSGSKDTTVRIWEVETGRAVGEPLRGHTDCVQSVAVSPDGWQIASGSEDRAVSIWDFETHEELRVLEGHSSWVTSVVFTPDSEHVVSGSLDDTIRVWDVESGETVLGPLHGHEWGVWAVVVAPDGRYIASASDDQTVRLWNAETGEAVGPPLRGHTRAVTAVAFSPDGRRVVSSSYDKTLMIWDVYDLSSTS